MATSFLSPAEAAEFNAGLRDLFATKLEIGPTVDLLLYRDDEADGTETQVGPQTVLMTLAKREAAPEGGDAAGFVGSDGEFAKAVPFDVKQGDRFFLPTGTGTETVAGSITNELPAVRGVARAAFRLEG